MAYDATDFTATVRMLDRDPKSLTEPRERLEYLRDFLRELPSHKFTMQSWGHNLTKEHCGSPGCICGWTNSLFPESPLFIGDTDAAGLALGISWRAAKELFEPVVEQREDYTVYRSATPTQAANVLDHLIRTGEVDWSVA